MERLTVCRGQDKSAAPLEERKEVEGGWKGVVEGGRLMKALVKHDVPFKLYSLKEMGN